VKSRGSARGVNKVFAATPETGIVYVSQPDMLQYLQDESITVSLYISLVNNTRPSDADDGSLEETASLRRDWLSVVNISVHVQRIDTVYNDTQRKRTSFV